MRNKARYARNIFRALRAQTFSARYARNHFPCQRATHAGALRAQPSYVRTQQPKTTINRATPVSSFHTQGVSATAHSSKIAGMLAHQDTASHCHTVSRNSLLACFTLSSFVAWRFALLELAATRLSRAERQREHRETEKAQKLMGLWRHPLHISLLLGEKLLLGFHFSSKQQLIKCLFPC